MGPVLHRNAPSMLQISKIMPRPTISAIKKQPILVEIEQVPVTTSQKYGTERSKN